MASKLFTFDQVAQHKSRGDLYVVIHNKVYDVTAFVAEHPGGEEVLLDEGGRDATESFEDVGHSDDARELLKKYYIGDLDPSSVPPKPERKSNVLSTPAKTPEQPKGNALRILIPLVVLVGYVYARYYYF